MLSPTDLPHRALVVGAVNLVLHDAGQILFRNNMFAPDWVYSRRAWDGVKAVEGMGKRVAECDDRFRTCRS